MYVYEYSSSQCNTAAPLRELTCHMGSHSVTCHPAEVTFPPLPQLKLVLDYAIPDLVGLLHTEMVYRPEDGHLSKY